MEDLTKYRLTKLEEEVINLKKDVTPIVERSKFWNEWGKIVLAAIFGACAREIIIYLSKHVSFH